MSRHKRFTDGAGFTRHCWECVHATNWRKVISFDGHEADCELTGRHVEKHSSPNNQCSHLPAGCRYETEAGRMTATDELRRLLDERGVEWDELVGHPVVVGTEWHDRDGYPCAALEYAYDVPDGMLSVQANLTPAQAIEATLGRGTCHDVAIEGEWFECSECRTVKQLIHPHYCPNCGRRVVAGDA